MPRINGTPVRKWVFTLNNYTDEDILMLSTLYPDTVKYLVFGREVGAEGTPHLQGFVWFKNLKSFIQAKVCIGQRAHLEKANGSPAQNRVYCTKDGDFEEFGGLVTGAGKRTDWDDLKEWLMTRQDDWPSDLEMLNHNPSLWGRCRRGCVDFRKTLCHPPVRVEGELRDWQVDLALQLAQPPHDRHVLFVVDTLGGKGKTWFQKKLLLEGSDDVQMLMFGKRDDMAYAVQEGKKIYMINVARGQMEYMQYSVLEMLKDGVVHSPKYESGTKFMNTPHVVVFSNEWPDMFKLTEDRYLIINLDA
nr:MAG: hypothetical protein [Chemarfal virus 268]